MTAAQADFWRRANRRVAGLQGAALAATLRAYRIIRDSFTDAELSRLIASGMTDHVLAEAFTLAALARAALPVRQRMRQMVEQSFGYVVKDLPRAGKVDGVLAVQFNVLSPDVVTALRALDGEAMRPFTEEVRATIKQTIESGLTDSISPSTIARQVRDVIGLAPNQATAVANFRAALESGDAAKALGYTLRDKRFDARVASGDLSSAQIDAMTDAYRKKMLAFNAETVSRTNTLNAYKQGQQLAWKEAQDAGVVPPDSIIMKRWIHFDPQPDPRPEHQAMHGVEVPLDALYPNGDSYPGEQDPWNCHCTEQHFLQAA